jgi:pyruvate/2-oxoglutarate dehydrogenase complex dihydrolipoamide acyltransferase (E2) component
MERNIENVDAWVVARIGELERANRRLWIGIGALFTTLASLALAGGLFAAHFEVPAGVAAAPGGKLAVDELELRHALRIVDDQGRDLVWLGREKPPGAAAASGEQTVLGLFAANDSEEPQQTVRVATSRLGSALSLSSQDGAASSSLFAGKTGVSLELRRGSAVTSWSERSGAPAAAPAPAPAPAPPAPAPAAAPASGARAESDALAARITADAAAAAVDLTNPTLQSLGSGFFVGPTSVTDSAGGIRVRGRIVNATSIDQTRAEFRITVGKREVAFSVARIAAGASAPFALEMAQAASAEIRGARMRWVRSSVSYGSE